jgi:hypothetical protein
MITTKSVATPNCGGTANDTHNTAANAFAVLLCANSWRTQRKFPRRIVNASFAKGSLLL